MYALRKISGCLRDRIIYIAQMCGVSASRSVWSPLWIATIVDASTVHADTRQYSLYSGRYSSTDTYCTRRDRRRHRRNARVNLYPRGRYRVQKRYMYMLHVHVLFCSTKSKTTAQGLLHVPVPTVPYTVTVPVTSIILFDVPTPHPHPSLARSLRYSTIARCARLYAVHHRFTHHPKQTNDLVLEGATLLSQTQSDVSHVLLQTSPF